MKRENLRKVEIKSDNYLKAKRNDAGYFHQWAIIGDHVDGYVTIGIIELKSGHCIQVDVGDFIFTD